MERSEMRVPDYALRAPSGLHIERRPNWRGYISRPAEHRTGKATVVVHVADQVLDAVEPQLGADPADEGHVERAAVKLPGKIEQVHLEERRAAAEGRPAAEIGHPVVHPPIE